MIKIKLGMIGGGPGAFIGDAHRRAARISNQFEFVGGAFSTHFDKTLQLAREEGLSIKRCYHNVEELVAGESALSSNERMEAVIIASPNKFHFSQAKTLLEGGFHVICDKPVTTKLTDALKLKEIIDKSGKVFCLTHTYTGYPMVRQMREFIKQGMLGKIQRIDVQYYQGWVNPLIHGKTADLNIWRLNPDMAGISSCMADIGVHAFNLIEYTTQLPVKQLLADLNNVSPNVQLDLDGTVLLRFGNGTKGVLRSSQVANGEENGIQLAIYGSEYSLKWQQENPNVLYKMCHGKPTQIYKPGNNYNTGFAEKSHTMPFGHPEGYYEAFANLYYGAAKAIKGKDLYDGEFPGIDDGIRGMKFIETVVESYKSGSVWMGL